jgi:hypothetical protein
MDGYTTADSGQRLSKHVLPKQTTPITMQQILNNATVGLQHWKIGVFYVVRAEKL